MNEQLRKKVLELAAQICWMHGSLAGDRTYRDWSADTKVLDSLTPEERHQLAVNGKDFKKKYFAYDEMVISFTVAKALEVMIETATLPCEPLAKDGFDLYFEGLGPMHVYSI